MKGIIPGWNEIKTDFPNYYISSQQVIQGESVDKLYDGNWFQEQIYKSGIKALGKFSPQPPIAALIMTPIAWLKPLTAKRVWLLMSLAFLVGSIILAKRLFSLSTISATIAMIIMGRGLANDIYYGQVYLMITFGILLSLWLIRFKKMKVLGGSILAIVSILKYFPALFVIYFIVKKENKVVASFLLTLVVLFIFQIVYFGSDFIISYALEVLPAHLSGDIPNQGGFAISYQSWPSFLNNLFVFHPDYNITPLINWSAGRPIMLLLVYSCVVFISSWFLLKVQRSNLEEPVKSELLLINLIVSGLVLLPATASYHFLFLFIPACIMLKRRTDHIKIVFISLIVAILFLPYPFSSYDNFFMLILSYPRLGAISLMLMATYYLIHTQLKQELK